MCLYSIPSRKTPLNRGEFPTDSGEIILDVSPNGHFFETLDWSEDQQVVAQQQQLICYDNGGGCGRSSSSLLHTSNTEFVSSVPSTSPPSSPVYDLLGLQDLDITKSTNDSPQAIVLDELSLLLSSSSAISNDSDNATLSACTIENATTTKAAERVRPDHSKETSEKSHVSNQEKRKDIVEPFEELLSLQGFNVARRSNPTLNEIRIAEEVKNSSHVSIKVQSWVDGKEGNIRALLASLNDVLWEGAEHWPHHRMADLLNENQVKKCYHRACLLVHPDKHVGQEHEKLARAIFTELNDAWNVFMQSSGSLK